jgi:hypothetical protein
VKVHNWFLETSLPRYLVYTATVTAIVGGALEMNVLYWIAGIFAAAAALWSAEQNAASTKLLRKQSEKIGELSTRNACLVTGGDSFCYLDITGLDEGTDVGMCVVVQQGDYPLFDVSARIVDLQLFSQITEHTIKSVLSTDQVMEIGNLAAGSASMAYEKPFMLGSSDARDFNIFFSARNGFFNQKLRFRKCNGHWLRKISVTRDGQTIFELDDPGFPMEEPDSAQPAHDTSSRETTAEGS